MRILFFTSSSYKYAQSKSHYFGSGWVDSLIQLLEGKAGINLGLSFFHEKDNEKVVKDHVTYYPIYKAPRRKSPIKTVIGDWLGTFDDESAIQDLTKVIEDFKPDVIQVFGVEGVFAYVQKHTDVPVLVHLQGLLNPYCNAYYPVNQSKWNFLFNPSYFVQNILGKGPSFAAKRYYGMARRENEHFKNLKFVTGRTGWDRLVTNISNPNITYFNVNEVLRPIFYEKPRFKKKRIKDQRLQLVSTISPTIYKGIDVVLKTAKLLRQQTNIDFSWKVIGVAAQHRFVRHFEKSLDIYHSEVNLEFLGIKKPEDFIDELRQSDLYIHPSYIDNSPNSVCEAQMVGLPVIACHVGGLSSLIEHGETGILVPSNGVYEIVHFVTRFISSPEPYAKMGQKAMAVAKERHDREKILEELVRVYHSIRSDSNVMSKV
ncbi:glycosyltransferase [Maribacter sp. 2307ULW6-5]|uniref:glycosyltransferase n=1 Tax=Maribacter sp. 2307ULW6-5 TaxID=3386275 RepID=UPI0039BCCBE7